MTTATTIEAVPLELAADLPSLKRLQREMLQHTAAAKSKPELLQGLVQLVDLRARTLEAFYYSRDEQGRLGEPIAVSSPGRGNLNSRLAALLNASCQSACRSGNTEIRALTTPACILVTAPVALLGGDPECFSMIFRANQSNERLVALVQVLVSHIILWHAIAASRASQTDAQDAAALVELVDQIITSTDVREACFTLTTELNTFLQSNRVAIGLQSGGRCRLHAVSGVAQFDKRSASAQAMESAFDEAVLRNDLTQWPAAEEQRHAALAHKQLCTQEEAGSVVSMPLRDGNEDAVGAILVIYDSADSAHNAERFLQASEQPLAQAISAAQRIDGGRLGRVKRAAAQLPAWKYYIALGVVVAVLAAMFIPLPHKVRCDCQIEPVTRRFVAAPFEGSLEKAFAKPGDIVQEGDLLARLDGRELRWRRATLVADQNQAIKRRDTAQATHSYADQQIAKLEIERLGLELELLDHRTKNLEITSPISGIVASGDLERTEGAPLTIGQTLFEIAPLDTMIVEVAVPDDDIALITSGRPIEIRLDAYPGQTWSIAAVKIQPRSEIRDDANVFIVEAELDNTDGRLRPGMKGRAKINTGQQFLGWIAFHKPWEFVVKKLSW